MEQKVFPDFGTITFDTEKHTFTIHDGTQGTWNNNEVKAVDVRNEKASVHGRGTPFASCVPAGALPQSMFVSSPLYVGLEITLKNGEKLACYVSKAPVQKDMPDYVADRETARDIQSVFGRIIKKYAD